MAEIIVHEADAPVLSSISRTAESRRQHGRHIDLFPVHADAAAGGDRARPLAESDRARCPGLPCRPIAHHPGDLPDQFNREAVPARAADAIHEAAKDLQRLGFATGNEGVVQAGDLLPMSSARLGWSVLTARVRHQSGTEASASDRSSCVFASREDLWRDHLFEPLLLWVSESLPCGRIVLFEYDGITEAKLVTSPQESARATRIVALR